MGDAAPVPKDTSSLTAAALRPSAINKATRPPSRPLEAENQRVRLDAIHHGRVVADARLARSRQASRPAQRARGPGGCSAQPGPPLGLIAHHPEGTRHGYPAIPRVGASQAKWGGC
jgi:hypothetical protein